MKNYLIIGLIIAGLVLAIFWQQERINVIKKDRDSYKQNVYTLLDDIDRYQTKDSLNAISVNQLELKLVEIIKYRADDMKLIETLKVDKNRLQKIITTQTQTIYDLKGEVKDSIIWRERFEDEFLKADSSFKSVYADTLKCIRIMDKWFDLNGCIDANSKFAGRFENRDSLLYVEHIIPKRFLFIKWGVKERRQEIVSRNPHTVITGAEFITIRK